MSSPPSDSGAAPATDTESAHVRRTLLTAVGFGGNKSLLRCTFCASARDSMAKFDRFLLFSASLECQWKTVFRQWPKTAEIDQGWEAKAVRNDLPPPLSDSVTNIQVGLQPASLSRSKSPSTLPAPGEAALCFNNSAPYLAGDRRNGKSGSPSPLRRMRLPPG